MDNLLLIKATLRIYQKSLKNTYEQFIHCWKYLFFHLIVAIVCLIVSTLAGFIPGIAGGFILGIFLALAAACYLASISSAFSKEKKSFQDLFYHGLSIFNPLIGFLFSLFIVRLLADHVQEGIGLFIVLIVAVIFNPMPEIVQLRPAVIMQMFSESIEFVRDNLVEWNLPFFILIGVVYLIEPNWARSLFYFLATTNPIDLIQFFLLNFTVAAFTFFFPLTLLSIIIFYLLFLFRINLFHALSSSTRRKRIYSERNQ